MAKSFIKKLGKDSLLYVPSKVIPGLLGFVSIIIYTRFLTPEQYGRYSLVFGAFTFINTLTFSWLNEAVLRFNDEHVNENKDEFYSTILTIIISLSVILILLSYLILNYFLDFSPELIILINLSILFYPIRITYKTVLRILSADRNVKIYSFISSLNKILYVAIIYILLRFTGLNEESLIITQIGVVCLLLALQVFVLKDDYSFVFKFKYFNKKYFKDYVKYGAPWIGVTVGNFLLSRGDRYLIEYFLSTDLVGIYTMTYSLAEKSILQFASILTISALPILIEDYNEDDNQGLTEMMKQLLRVYGILFIPAAFGLAVLSEEIILVFLGGDYYLTNSIFILISFAAVFEAFRLVFSRPLILQKKTYIFPFLYIGTGIINIVMNIILIPTIGINGAAIATIVGYISYVIIVYNISGKYFEWDIPWKTFIKCFFSSIIMTILIYFNPIIFTRNLFYIIFSVIFGGLIYFVILYLLKEKLLLTLINNFRKN